ncbi:hypothetical protein Droror1_Dr00005342 [Drosera rotundifolia]
MRPNDSDRARTAPNFSSPPRKLPPTASTSANASQSTEFHNLQPVRTTDARQRPPSHHPAQIPQPQLPIPTPRQHELSVIRNLQFWSSRSSTHQLASLINKPVHSRSR